MQSTPKAPHDDKALLLRIRELTLGLRRPGKIDSLPPLMDQMCLDVGPGQTVGLVGESGCGKSLTALSILGLLPKQIRVLDGEIRFHDKDLLKATPAALRRLRGNAMAMIFQEPLSALNPTLTVGRQVAEPLMVHRGMGQKDALEQAIHWLQRVRIPGGEDIARAYPHELSGGMRQRAMIAMAMICKPRLLIADEPTTALDATIEREILALMLELQAHMRMAMLLISHNLALVAQAADHVVVMYAGQVVEAAPVRPLFEQPFHPYTRGLLRSLPTWEANAGVQPVRPIEGVVPLAENMPLACRFAPRCPHVFAPCRKQVPPLAVVDGQQRARCWLIEHPQRRRGHD